MTARRHRAPPAPPKFLPLCTPIAAAAVLLAAASVVAICAPGAAWDVRAEPGVTVPTASRATRTVQIPLTILPAPVPTIGAAGAWDPETVATPTAEIALSGPRSFAGVQGHAAATVTTPTTSTEVTQAITTADRPPATLPADAATENTTTAASPASTFEAAATTSSAPTSTEEATPMTTEPTETAEPTDVIGDVTDVIGEVGP